ncbi:MAG: coproporphyrinogen-III oxidase family protein [Deferrisomatales bacterium]
MAHSIYIHVPFCRSRCRYCAFYSGEPLDRLDSYPSWVAAEAELRAAAGSVAGPAHTVYFGGGTPSLLGPRGLGAVLAALDRTWGIAAGAEVTVEVNPADRADLAGLAAAGANRLSIGVQALDDSLLAALGRPHRAADALETLDQASRAGFRRLSVDLLYGLPGLAPRGLADSAARLTARGANHLSAYSLELHPGTPLDADARAGLFLPPTAAEEEAQWDSLLSACRRLGLPPYEVSNFASSPERCRHNLAYWRGNPYLGLGPGAHGYAPALGPFGTRWWNHPGLDAYRDALARGHLPPGGEERLDRRAALLEGLFLALRCTEPLLPGRLEATFALTPGALAPAFALLAREGLVRPGPGGLFAPTPEGLRRADGLALWLLDTAQAPAPGAALPEAPPPRAPP